MATIKKSVLVNVPLAQAWDALTNRETMAEWYFDIPDLELKEGAVFNFYESEKKQYHHRGTVLEVVPNTRFSHTWTHPNESNGSSVVTWTLAPEGEKTRITLRHEGTENFADAGSAFATENFDWGWEGIVEGALVNYLKGLRKSVFEIDIAAAPEVVWQNLWNDDSYRKWSAAFAPGCYKEGQVQQGANVRFLSGEGSGMNSMAVYVQAPHVCVLKHIGFVKEGLVQPPDAESEKWIGATEQYHLAATPDGTHLKVEVEGLPDWTPFFESTFPKALELLKEISTSADAAALQA